MGAVLAMNAVLRIAVLLLAAAMLAGCGTLGARSKTGPAPDPRAGLTRAALDAAGKPVLYVALPKRNAASLLGLMGRNGTVLTWQTPDNISLAFDEGVLTATRGLGFDLMSAETTQTRRMLAGAAMRDAYPRLHGYLDGEHRHRFKSYLCRRAEARHETLTLVGATREVTRITETCTAPGVEFTNLYWRGADGVIWKSRQWAGHETGLVETELLRR